jgi:multidrug efflux pump
MSSLNGSKQSFAKYFVDRPIFAAVLSIVIFLAGLIALPNLPISEYPNVVPPSVSVRAIYPGGDPKTISETVAAPIEEAINGVENMIYMKSVAGSDGVMTLTVTFKQGTNIDDAAVLVQNRVAQAVPRLPDTVRALGVTTTKQSPTLTMVVHLTSPDGRYDSLYLRNFATLRIKDEIARIPGVGQALLFGSGDYAMRVWIDPEKAAARNISASDIVNAIREQNVQVSAGSIGAPPMPNGSDFTLSINAPGRLVDEKEFAEIVIKTDAARGDIVQLGDIARLELGASEYALRALLDNKQAVAIPIFETPGANSVELSDNVRAKMAELAKQFPPGVQWSVVYDPTVFVRESIKEVVKTLLEAVFFVVLVVIVFLQTWRASIIPLIAVPVSIVGTFAVLWALGFTINVLTLFGLVLAIGIVVDDAIVVVENVERYIEEGLKPIDAAYRAMKEVSSPIIAIALVLCAVFVPISLLDGVTGQFYRQFAVTIAISTVISAFNSLTLSPALAALLLKEHGAPKDRLSKLIDAALGWFFRPFNRFFTRSSNAYAFGVKRIVSKGALMMVIYGALLMTTVGGFLKTPVGFIPMQDKLYLIAGAILPEGSSLERTEAVIKKMGDIALQTDGVESAVQFPGLNGLQFTNTPNMGAVFFALDPAEKRNGKRAEEIVGELYGRFGSEIKEGIVFAFMPPPVQGLGNAAGFDFYIQDRSGAGFGELGNMRNALFGALMSPEMAKAGILQPFSSYQFNVPQLSAEIDRVKAKEQSVPLSELFQTLQVYMGSSYVNDFNRFGRTYQVYAQADASFRDSIEDINGLKVRSLTGEMVPLGALVKIKQTAGPDPVIRYNGYPAADILGGVNPALMSSSESLKTVSALANNILPNGFSFEWTNLSFQEVTQGNAALYVFPLCVFLVWLVLAALYESWTLPLSVILIVPMAMLSAIGGIWLANWINGLWFGMQIAAGKIPPPPMSVPPMVYDNNIFTQIGLVVLMGLACKNAILIVEFARELEQRGMGIVEAALESCRLRLRPILMTSFAFIMGVIPLLIATGAGAEVRKAMGLTVFSGMLGVTFFGLFLTPVFYVLIRKVIQRSAPIPMPHDDEPALISKEIAHG